MNVATLREAVVLVSDYKRLLSAGQLRVARVNFYMTFYGSSYRVLFLKVLNLNTPHFDHDRGHGFHSCAHQLTMAK